MVNLGNVVGLLTSPTPPAKKNVLWAKQTDFPAQPDEVVLHYFDAETGIWEPLTGFEILPANLFGLGLPAIGNPRQGLLELMQLLSRQIVPQTLPQPGPPRIISQNDTDNTLIFEPPVSYRAIDCGYTIKGGVVQVCTSSRIYVGDIALEVNDVRIFVRASPSNREGVSVYNTLPYTTADGTSAGQKFTVTPISEFRDRFDETFTGTVQEFATRLLVVFQKPQFGNFTVDGHGTLTVPVGRQFAGGAVPVRWTTTNQDNIQQDSITLRDVTSNEVLASAEKNDGDLTATVAAFSAVRGLSRTYLLAGVNKKGDFFAADISIYGQYESYFGYSSNPDLDGAGLVALGHAQLQDGRSRNLNGVTASGGTYFYYAYEASAGDLTNVIMDGAAPVLGALRKLADKPTANGDGAPVTLRVYRSNAQDAFTNNALSFS